MHEISIVDALIEQVGREVHRSGAHGKILEIHLSIGRLSGVNPDSLRFAFDLLAPGTLLEGTNIVMNEIRAVCNCHACNARVEIDDLTFQCPKCGSDSVTIEGGRDLLLQTIDVEDGEKVDSG
jgi:hydrogenase nickel incorporation protein HypA/HybF